MKKSALLKRIDELEGLLQEREAVERAIRERPQPYELVNARTTYVSDDDPWAAAVALLAEAQVIEGETPEFVTSLTLTVSYTPAGADGVPSYFAGQLTVEG